jgi:hypothetical protein
MVLSPLHKGILVGLVIGVVGYHFWQQRAGKSSPEGG